MHTDREAIRSIAGPWLPVSLSVVVPRTSGRRFWGPANSEPNHELLGLRNTGSLGAHARSRYGHPLATDPRISDRHLRRTSERRKRITSE